MKKITLCLMLVLALIIVPGAVLATGENGTEVGTAEELLEAVKSSGTVTLTANIELDTELRVEKGVNVVLNLNGKTLSLPALGNYAATVKGDLTITGNGTVNVTGAYGIVAYGGNLTIENGTYNGPEAIYLIADYGGKVLIKDGTFYAKDYAVNGLVEHTVNPVEIQNGIFNNSVVTSDDCGSVLGNVKISKGQFNSIIRGELLAENAEITIKLDQDNDLSNLWCPVESESIVISNGSKVTLDLNGHNITSPVRAFIVDGADFTIKGEGKISVNNSADAVIAVKGSNNVNDKNYTTVNVEQGVVLEGLYGLFVAAVDDAYAYAVKINFNGKTTDGGIYTNGNIKHTENCPVINIGSDANIAERGIYAAGYAEWNIDGATISGIGHGIGIKSGKFNIKNATIVGTGPDSRPTDGFNNGMNNSGAAIQIESNKGYAGKIDINVENSTLESKNCVTFYEYLATFEDNDKNATTTAVNSLKISNTDFIAKEGLENFDISSSFKSNITKFINSGKFTTDVKEYIADGVVCKKVNESYLVNKEHSIVVEESEGGTVIVREANGGTETILINKAIFGETVEIVVEPKEGYRFKEITGAEGIDDVAEYAYQFTMPDKDVTLIPVFEKIAFENENTQVVEVPNEVENIEKVESMLMETLKELAKEDTELSKLLNESNIEVIVDISDNKDIEEAEKQKIEETANKEIKNIKIAKYIDITIAVKDADNGTSLDTLGELKEEITFKLPIPTDLPEVPEGYTRVFYIIRDHNGDVDVLKTTTTNGEISFSSKYFSTYAIAYVDVENQTEGEAGEGTNNPATGDNIVLYVVVTLIAVAGIFTTIAIKRKSNTKK